MRYQHVKLDTFGYELPPRKISSTEIEQLLSPVYDRLKLPKGRLELMSGIKERRLWNKGTKPSDGAVLAGRKALKNSFINPEDIGCLIFTSVSRDMMEPATASFVHDQLDLPKDCLVFDISNACLGFLDGMVMLASMIELGHIKNGLLVAGEIAEELVESTIDSLLTDQTLTRKSIKSSIASLTIGSGAVSLVMSRTENEDGIRMTGGASIANTKHITLCQGGSIGANTTLMTTDSETLLHRGVETAHALWPRFLKTMNWQPKDIDTFFCHQVGSAHARLLFETLGLAPEKNFETLPILGNVGSVSAPITMAMGIEQGILQRGNKAALLGIGSGINSMMLGIEWG